MMKSDRMTSQLGRKILTALVCVASLISSRPLLSEEPFPSAVDAQGVRHYWREHGSKNPPWFGDIIKKVSPRYPSEARSQHMAGTGLFRLTLDMSTGSVAKVTVIKSTGKSILDNSAIDAFRQCRWKPGKWKEIEIPVVFIRR
jgi:TonB family protein